MGVKTGSQHSVIKSFTHQVHTELLLGIHRALCTVLRFRRSLNLVSALEKQTSK